MLINLLAELEDVVGHRWEIEVDSCKPHTAVCKSPYYRGELRYTSLKDFRSWVLTRFKDESREALLKFAEGLFNS